MALQLILEEKQRLDKHIAKCSRAPKASILVTDPARCNEVVALYQSKTSIREISRRMDMALITIYKILKAKGVRN